MFSLRRHPSTLAGTAFVQVLSSTFGCPQGVYVRSLSRMLQHVITSVCPPVLHLQLRDEPATGNSCYVRKETRLTDANVQKVAGTRVPQLGCLTRVEPGCTLPGQGATQIRCTICEPKIKPSYSVMCLLRSMSRVYMNLMLERNPKPRAFSKH